ncbi:CRISPR-associated protein Cas6 [Halobacteriales archaeon QS_6_71_20]|nr:MAG: CRISPR-associated protein Cas6 [Halobacteriales archaeon QS_6_71_20]
MRIVARLRARADAAYLTDYHAAARARIWNALAGTAYEGSHDDNDPPGFVFSNPFPPRDMEEGDRRTLLISAPDEQLLVPVAEDLQDDPELNLKQMPFSVEGLSVIHPDVGEPGSSGVIETGTGLLVRIPPWRCDDYGIEHPQGADGDTAVYWRPTHGIEPLREQVENNLDRKHDLFAHDTLPGPSDRPGALFDGYELLKTFAVPVQVTENQELTYVLNKFRLSYEVRDDHHRRHLNLALDCGLGERNALGLGFLNLDEKYGPYGEPAPEVHAG